MKRTVSIILALLLCMSLCACGTSSESSSSDTQEEADVYSNAEIESSSEKSHELTDDEVEMIVVQELYNQISTSKWHQADPGSCRYSINKTERKPGFIYIYGEVYLYDKYGKLTTGYSDGSGSYSHTFEIEYSLITKSVYKCIIEGRY